MRDGDWQCRGNGLSLRVMCSLIVPLWWFWDGR